MIPREPARRSQLGFLYIPPYRIQGLSVAGEETAVQVPELDLCFDIGLCPRPALTSSYVALSHGHMDHAAALPYYFSQRHFQGMGTGTVLCHQALERPIHNVMGAWVDVEVQRTPYKVIAMEPGQELAIKKNIYVRAFATVHTVPSLGFIVVERRSKLLAELAGLPQERLVELKSRGVAITQTIEIPLVCYTGDTAWGKHFDRPDVQNAKILITECTFLDPAHRDRAHVGKHLHLEEVVRLLRICRAEAVVLTHLSRRTHLGQARKQIDASVPPDERHRVFVLMDGRSNRAYHERLEAEQGQTGEGEGEGE